MRDSIKEYDEVAKAAEKFVKSVAEGNSEYAKTLFTDDAVLFGILDGAVERGSIEQFYPQCGYRWWRRRLQGSHRRAGCRGNCGRGAGA